MKVKKVPQHFETLGRDEFSVCYSLIACGVTSLVSGYVPKFVQQDNKHFPFFSFDTFLHHLIAQYPETKRLINLNALYSTTLWYIRCRFVTMVVNMFCFIRCTKNNWMTVWWMNVLFHKMLGALVLPYHVQTCSRYEGSQ